MSDFDKYEDGEISIVWLMLMIFGIVILGFILFSSINRYASPAAETLTPVTQMNSEVLNGDTEH